MAKKNQAPVQTNKRPGICQYCGKPEAFDGPFCSKECKQAYEEGMKRDQPRVKLYMMGMIAGALILAYGGFAGSHVSYYDDALHERRGVTSSWPVCC